MVTKIILSILVCLTLALSGCSALSALMPSGKQSDGRTPDRPSNANSSFEKQCVDSGGTYIPPSQTRGQQLPNGNLDATGPQCHRSN